jgi:uncharacterized protein
MGKAVTTNHHDADSLHAVHELETVWIPMSDGTRLAARMWLPAGADAAPVPAILEYIPYRRRDGSRERDDRNYPFLAARGYGCVRADIRGTGDSEGVIRDEYLKQEQDDALEIITWLASQSWCNGSVGMMGISWGGFNALQVAARRPPALKAIVSICSTDDRYADDMHYMGGAHLTGNLEWGSTFLSIMAASPDPRIVGERWRAMWLERLEASTPVFATWLEHQRRDAYWRHGSVCENIGDIHCAVMAVGGWADGYTNAVFRLLRDLKCPRFGIVGPWGHKYPNVGVPGPAIAFLTETLRWWDYWLKGIDTGIMRAPMLRAYIQDWTAPVSHCGERPGRWIAESSWPSEKVATERLFLNSDRLAGTGIEGPALRVCSPLTTGAASGEWCPYSLGGLGPELPTDQRSDDGGSLVFDGAALTAPLEILGAPELQLVISADRPSMQVIVRLNDVSPEGEVARVTYGVLNLTHRDGHADPKPLEPGARYTVTVRLNEIGYRFRQGHRVRVAVSTAYWPIVWPAPEQGILAVQTGLSSLTLPVRRLPAAAQVAGQQVQHETQFGPPEPGRPTELDTLHTGEQFRRITYDIATGAQRIDVLRDEGRWIIEAIGVEVGFHKSMSYKILPADPQSARMEAHYDLVHRDAHGWNTRVRTRSVIACTNTHYLVEADLEAFEGEARVFSRTWTRRIERDLS